MNNPNKNRNPISGLRAIQAPSLRECIQYAQTGRLSDYPPVSPCPRLHEVTILECRLQKALDAGQDAQQLADNTLTVNEAAAIHFYTQPSRFYAVVNDHLRMQDREKLKCFLPYLRLLLDGLYKLSLVPRRTVYRGVNAKLISGYLEGREFVWWTITSTSLLAGVAASFTGAAAVGRTLFTIDTRCIVDITKYSAIEKESECILLPGSCA